MSSLTAERPIEASAGPELRHAAKAAGLLTLAQLVVSLGNLAFNVLIARLGGAAAFGGIGALLGLATVGGFLTTGVQLAFARRVAVRRLQGDVLQRSLRLVWRWTLAAPLVLLALAIPLSAFLRFGNVLPGFLGVLLVLVLLVSAIPTGIALGQERFGVVASVAFLTVAMRFAVGVVLVQTLDSVVGALVASIVPVIFGTAFVTIAVMRPVRRRQPRVRTASTSNGSLPAEGMISALMSAALWLMWSLPLLYARHYLPLDISGQFAAAQILCSAIPFGTGAIVMAFFPAIARRGDSRVVVVGLVATAGVACIGALVIAVAGPFIIGRLYGSHFATTRTLLVLLVVAGTLLALASYALWVSRALQRYSTDVAIFLSMGLGTEFLTGLIWHGGALQLAGGLAMANLAGITCVVGFRHLRATGGRVRLGVVSLGDD